MSHPPRVGRVLLSVALPALVLGACSTPAPQVGGALSAPHPISTSASAPAPTSTTAADTRCRLDDLGAERADGAYVDGRNQVRVVWTNRSQRTCTMTGFGGVDLVDARGKRVSVAREDATAGTVELAPGARAHSTISYVAAGGSGVFSPRTALATPPDETRSAELPWGTGGIPLFDAPSNVELGLSPVRPGAA